MQYPICGTSTFKQWHGMTLVYVPNVEGLSTWLQGQTIPVVEEDSEPLSWCYFDDYVRFINNSPIID